MESSEQQPPAENFEKEAAKQKSIVFGAQQAASYIRKVAAGEKVGGVRPKFDQDFVMEVHRRVVFGQTIDPGLRRRYGVTLGDVPVSHWEELPMKMYLYGKWLEGGVEAVKQDPDNVIKALEIACAAHYGLVQRDFHPFYNGNGRTARAISNAILMLSTYELRVHNLAIFPVPLVRDADSKIDQKYIKALNRVNRTETLNPLMVFMARRWAENLSTRLQIIGERIKNPRLPGDKKLIENTKQRLATLSKFIAEGEINDSGGGSKEGAKVFPIPRYFDPFAPRINTPFSQAA